MRSDQVSEYAEGASDVASRQQMRMFDLAVAAESPAGITPKLEYQRRREARGAAVNRLKRLHRRVANARIGVFLLAAVLAWLSFWLQWLSGFWVLAMLAAFIALV